MTRRGLAQRIPRLYEHPEERQRIAARAITGQRVQPGNRNGAARAPFSAETLNVAGRVSELTAYRGQSTCGADGDNAARHPTRQGW